MAKRKAVKAANKAVKAKEYRVRWEIDVTATNPKEAARQALATQRDSESTATVFDVIETKFDSRGNPYDGDTVTIGVVHE